jgi:hydrogenase expression/formation protein HypC
MCLGIPGQVVELLDHPDLALVDVYGAKRQINMGLLEEGPKPGEWILIHVGFALQKLSDDEVELAQKQLEMMGSGSGNMPDSELDEVLLEQWDKEEAEQWVY